MTLLEDLGEFTHSLTLKNVPTEVVAKIKTLILHHLHTGFSGIKELESNIAVRLVERYFRDEGQSTILGQKKKHSAIGASFVNGVLMHSVQQEDTYRGLHPGPHTIPAAFALGEEFESSGAEILAAILAGYEINLQIGEACMKYTSPRGWRGTTIYGVLGVASTAARVLSLNQDMTENAIANSINLASGLMQCWLEGTSEWLFASGLAAQNGVISALIAKEGGTGAKESFEGNRGYFKAYCGVEPDEVDIDSIELGTRYVTPEVMMKPYSVITTILPVIHNIVELTKEHHLKPEDVRKINLEVGTRVTRGPLQASILDYGPFVNKTQAYKSLPCATGIAIVSGNVTAKTADHYQEKSVHEIAQLVTIDTDESIEGFYNRVEIITEGSGVLSIEGDKFPSLTDLQVRANLMKSASEYLSKTQVQGLIDAIDKLDKVTMEEITQNLS
ncbi:MAG: MmgE/PrpD family protein [Candidatus Thorarchaeota archaeon]